MQPATCRAWVLTRRPDKSKVGGMKTAQLASLTREVAVAIRSETALPSGRRRLQQICTPDPLDGFRQLERPSKDTSDLTRRIDSWAERLFLNDNRIREALGPFVTVSEERGVLYYPDDFQPEKGRTFTLLMLDPVDNTELVIRRLGGAVSACIASGQLSPDGHLERADLVAVAVADVSGGEVFFTGVDCSGPGVSNGNGEERCLKRQYREGGDVSLSAVLVKASRFRALASRLANLELPGGRPTRFFLHHGGPLPLCRVAAGDLDLAFDLEVGYKAMDYAPGLWIAAASGCAWQVLDEQGELLGGFDPTRLRIPEGKDLESQLLGFLKQRTRFAVAHSPELLDQALCEFQNPKY